MNAYFKFASVAFAACLALVAVTACEQRVAGPAPGESAIAPTVQSQPDLENHDP